MLQHDAANKPYVNYLYVIKQLAKETQNLDEAIKKNPW